MQMTSLNKDSYLATIYSDKHKQNDLFNLITELVAMHAAYPLWGLAHLGFDFANC